MYKWWQALTTKSISEPCSVADTYNRLEVDASNVNIMYTQSAIIEDSVEDSHKMSGVTEFTQGTPDVVTDMSGNPSLDITLAHAPEADLGNFFTRPVVINSFDWTPNTNPSVKIEPWRLWLSNPRVSNRLTNFRNFRGKLCVRVVLNGNSFYWGKMLASYMPYPTVAHPSYFTEFADVRTASQRQHLWLDPCTSQGGELKFPFFYRADSLNMTVNNGAELGELWFTDVAVLRHAQELTVPVRVTTFAWVEDIVLSGPTSTDILTLSPQSGRVDEFSCDGVVSQPAKLVAKLAGRLRNVPTIAPYAMATQMVSNGIAEIASAFGYSRARQVQAPMAVKPWNTGNMASTDAADTSMTLALTDKQEVTIDSRTVGLDGTDEMAFAHLQRIPSLVTWFPWNLSNNTYDPLFSIAVNPLPTTQASSLFPPGQKSYCLTSASGLVAMPFHYWRGSITYRFQIAASAFHRGRLLIVWDPVNSTATPELNTVYSKIVDISETKDFTLTVGWGHNEPALQVPINRITTPTNSYNEGLYPPSSTFDNGVLTVYVLNSLVSSGSSTAPIEILVHQWSDDLKVWSPSENMTQLTPVMQTQSGLVVQSGSLEQPGPNHDHENTDMILTHMGGYEDDSILATLAGECVESYRTLIKRYVLRRTLTLTDTPTLNNYSVYYAQDTNYPMYRAGDGSYKTNPMLLLYSCFAGWRGGIKWKYVNTFAYSNQHFTMGACRYPNAAITGFAVATAAANPSGTFNVNETADASWMGNVFSGFSTGGNLEFEVPYYSNVRMNPSGVTAQTTSLNMGHIAYVKMVSGPNSLPFEASWDVYTDRKSVV